MRVCLVVVILALVGCNGTPTEPTVTVTSTFTIAPTPTPTALFPLPPTCPAGQTYDVQSRSCIAALCPPGYFFELYVGCQWPTGAGPEPTPHP